MIAERTLEKLYSQAQKGYWGGGHAPLGYVVKEKKLVVDPMEAELVKRIFRYYLEEPSTTKVAARLDGEGYRTKGRITKAGKTTGSARFTKQSVRGILLNKVYLGIIRFKTKEFQGIHDAIISESDFTKVEQIMAESVKNPRATSSAESPLTLLGITQCGHCDSMLSSSSTFKKKEQHRYYYYKCSKAAHHTKAHCPSKDLPAGELESLTLSVVQGLVHNKAFLDAVVKQMEGNSTADTKQLEDGLRDLKANLAKATNELENLIRVQAEGGAIRSSEVFAKMISEREETRSSIKTRITALERSREKRAEAKVDRDTMQEILADYLSVYESFDKDQKRRLNQILFSAIVSYFKTGSTEGEIEFRIRGNGLIKKAWEDIKKGNQKVRTSGSLGSATGSIPRTTFWSKSLSKSTIWDMVSGIHVWTASVCPRNSVSQSRISRAYPKQALSIAGHKSHGLNSESTIPHFGRHTVKCSLKAASAAKLISLAISVLAGFG